MTNRRSENSYIVNDILPLLHSNYNYPLHDSKSVKINDVPIFRPSGGYSASTIDIVYYNNGIPLLLVEAKTNNKTHEAALNQALNYLKNFPNDKFEYSENGKKPKYIATTVGADIQFYKWGFDYERADFFAIQSDIISFDKLLVEYGLSKGYRPVILRPDNFKTDFFDELIDIFRDKDRKITPKIIKFVSDQILSYLWDKEKYYGQKPYVNLNLLKQHAVRDLFNKYNFIRSIGPDLAKEYRNVVIRAFQGGGLNQYLTESCIIEFMVKIIGSISKSSKVLDFECGSGGYLASILIKDKLPIINIKGIDIDELPYIVSKTYLALYFKIFGKNRIEKIPITLNNGLYNYGNNWNVIIGNPAGNKIYRHGNVRRILKEGLKRINSPKGNFSEYELSIQQAIRTVKSNGVICLLLTESFFSNSSDILLRKFVAENCRIKAIISLPRGVFKEGITTKQKNLKSHTATMKMSILLAKKLDKTKNIKNKQNNFKELNYPVFLASINEPQIKSTQIKEWLEPELNIIFKEWKKWNKIFTKR